MKDQFWCGQQTNLKAMLNIAACPSVCQLSALRRGSRK